MEELKVSRINKLSAPKGNLVGNGELTYGDIRVSFRVLARKDGSGVFPGLPSHKGGDGKYYDDVHLSEELKKELGTQVSSQWDSAKAFSKNPKGKKINKQRGEEEPTEENAPAEDDCPF